MKKLMLTLLFLLNAFILNSPLTAAEETNKTNIEDYEKTILLPINHMTGKLITLSIRIDKNYKSLQKDLNPKFMEFIPKGDDDNKWSQIITLQSLVGVHVSASAFLDKVKTGMKAQATSFKLLEENSKDMKDYSVASFGATYETNGRKEVVFMQYYSGPADIAGIQYAKPLGPNESPKKSLSRM